MLYENKDLWTANQQGIIPLFCEQAGLLASFIVFHPFPVSQWLTEKLPYTVTASLRIHTGFPFHPPRAGTCTLHFYIQFQIRGFYHSPFRHVNRI